MVIELRGTLIASTIAPCWSRTTAQPQVGMLQIHGMTNGGMTADLWLGTSKGKEAFRGATFLLLRRCVPLAALVRHCAAEGPLQQDCLPLPLNLTAWSTSHAPFHLLSFQVVEPHTSNRRIISASTGWQRLSLRLMCSLPIAGFAWNTQAACLCPPVLWKTQISLSSFPINKLLCNTWVLTHSNILK